MPFGTRVQAYWSHCCCCCCCQSLVRPIRTPNGTSACWSRGLGLLLLYHCCCCCCCCFQVGGVTPNLNDFKWATSVFWSRGLGLPIPEQRGDGVLRINMQEGLVPGLDFANHSQEVGMLCLFIFSWSCVLGYYVYYGSQDQHARGSISRTGLCLPQPRGGVL